MTIYPKQDALVRGELSPRLHARASLDLYRAGLAKCENFITLPHGGIRKRGGTYFVDEVPDSARKTRVIPFVFSDDQAYALVLGHQVMRVYAYGARVESVQITTPWTENEIFGVKFIQSADDMWLVHPNHGQRKLSRLSHTSWSLASDSYEDGPFDPVNTNEALTLYSSGTTGTVTIYASSALFTADMVGRLVRIDMQSYEDIPPWEPNAVVEQPTLDTKRRYEGNIYKTPTNYNLPGSHEARTGATPPTHTKGTEWDGQNSIEVKPDIDQASAADIINLDVYHGLQWTFQNPGYGVARITAFGSSTQVTATVLSVFPDEVIGSGNASNIWRLGAFSSTNNPDSVAIFEERLTYGKRFSVYGSKTGDFDTFAVGEKADDALVFRNAGGGQANDIVWLADIDGYLAIGTIGGVRSLSGSGIDEALTPTSFKNRNSRAAACANIQPVQAGLNYAYVAKGRKKIQELRLGQQLRFESEDLGQVSEHIPKKGVVELAFQETPDPVLWFPLDNGELGGFTHQPSQEVRGMHRHRLGGAGLTISWGAVESVCVTPGQNGEDDVWLVVNRIVNGVPRRYVEILTNAFEYGAIESAFKVDCGLSRAGAPTAAVTGLGHLDGSAVDALVDGRVYKGLTVSGGAVALPGGATGSVWHVGLPYEAGADTLEMDVGARDGSLGGRRKRVSKVILSVFETDLSGLQITSLQRERWEPVRVPTIAVDSGVASLFTGNVEVPIDDSWEGMGRIRIRHVNPTPCTIRAITPAFDSEP